MKFLTVFAATIAGTSYRRRSGDGWDCREKGLPNPYLDRSRPAEPGVPPSAPRGTFPRGRRQLL